MRITMIILVAGFLQVSAKGFTQTVTLKADHAPIQAIFREITSQTGWTFMFANDDILQLPAITIDVRNASLQDALKEIFINQPLLFSLSYEVKLVIIKKTQSYGGVVDKKINVHGIVKDDHGLPAASVSVKIKGTNRGVTTNSNGEFNFENVDENSVLVFTSINLQPLEINLSGRTELVISLKSRISELAGVSIGVVNTGYQVLNKERSVGAFSKLDSANYSRRAGVNILERLNGTVPGINFNTKGQKAPLTIRGISTLGFRNDGSPIAFDPLIIVDNFPFDGDINTINQNDVLDITVLKDAAAQSIWGTRAANGVIVITTKRGKYNQPLHVTVSSNVTITEKPNLFKNPILNSSDFIDIETFLFSKGFFDNNLLYPKYYVVSPVISILDKQKRGLISNSQATDQLISLRSIDSRSEYNNYYFRNAVAQQHFANLTGGSSNLNYNLSFGYNINQPGVQNEKPSQQYTINSINTFRPIKNLDIEFGLNLSQNHQNNYSSINFPFGTGFGPLPPYTKLRDANGNNLATTYNYNSNYIDTLGHGLLLDWHFRPLDEIILSNNVTNTQFLKLNVAVMYKITDWLKFEFRYQNIKQNSNNRNLQSQQSYYTRNLINLFSNFNQVDPHLRNPVPYGDILDVSDIKTFSQNARAQFNFNRTINNDHQISALVATDISESKGTYTTARLYGYNDNIGTFNSGIDYYTSYPWYDNIGSGYVPNNTSISEGGLSRIVSVLGNASYAYKGKYSFYISGRRDGANVFGVNINNKWKPLWSTGIGWDLLKDGLLNYSFINVLRLRATFGYTGNVDNSNSGKPTIGYTGTLPYTNFNVATVGHAPNPDLRWESTKTYNIGLDFAFLSNRVTGTVDLYQKRSFDVLSNTPIDPTSGVTTALVNAANLKGTGFEIQVRTVNTKGVVNWNTSFAIAYNKTIVTKYYNQNLNTGSFTSYDINPVQGKMAWGVYALRWAGLNGSNGNPQGYFKGQVSTDYRSIINDTIKNQVFVGSSIPLYSGYLFNSINWWRFSLSANITYKLNYYFRKPSLSYTDLFNGNNTNAEYLKRWTKPGDEQNTNVPSMIFPADANRDLFYQYSEINILKGDNIRLQDVRLSYDWQPRYRLNFVKSFQLFLYANNLNLIIWKANKLGYDPDYTGGTISSAYIPPKTFAAGINLGF